VIRSMTGHGAGEAPFAGGTVRVELRAVNNRHLDLRVKAPAELADVTSLVEDALRAACGRGRIEAQVACDVPSEAASLDLERARALYRDLCTLRDELAPGTQVPIEAVLRAPGLFASASSAPATDEVRAALLLATERAVHDLTAMRAREGAALSRDFEERIALMRGHAAWVAERGPEIVDRHRQRLEQRLEKLLAGKEVAIDPARLAQEVAVFADRADVAEELTRLGSHLDQFTHMLSEAEPVGRKLDFLVQELGREVNTIGSKANDAAIAQRVVEMKAELERVREQVQNVL
jgi:uncharacterized protein (TIGR00255 family)